MTATHSVLLAMAVLLTGGAVSSGLCILARRRERVPVLPRAVLLMAVLAAAAIVLGGASHALGRAPDSLPESAVSLPWAVPGGPVEVALDALGAWFAVLVVAVGACVAWFAVSYFAAYAPRTFAGFGLFFPLLLGALLGVAIARHALLFLAAWEVMTVSTFVLVVLCHEREPVRRAGRLYLVLNQLGTICLLLAFVLLGEAAGSFGFPALAQARLRPDADAALVGVLLLIGFGTKAGVWPFHVWLPYAHPAAETPVSAVLSGLVIKSGIFGLLRFLPLLPPLPGWLCLTWIGIGALSCVNGVLMAVAQKELKRLLAYSSIENVGICFLATGVGALGVRIGNAEVAALGFCGALLHMLNHALGKTALFLGAGMVLHGAGSTLLDRLGGLLRPMPWTALLFLAGAAALCGLPPGNAFVSEWTIYRALFLAVQHGLAGERIVAGGAILALALTGGLAVVCYARCCGVVFLGNARAVENAPAHDAPAWQRWAVFPLLAAALLIGTAPVLVFGWVWPAALQIARGLLPAAAPSPDATVHMLGSVAAAGAAVLGIAGLLWLVRRRLVPKAGAAATWGCGYSKPSPAMQYTATSFGWSVLDALATLVLPGTRRFTSVGPFPQPPAVESQVRDLPESFVLRPAWNLLLAACRPFRALQWPPVQLQLLLMLLTLAALLIWKVAL